MEFFEDSIVAYLDILGFQNAVVNNELPENTIIDLLKRLRHNNRVYEYEEKTRNGIRSVTITPNIYSFSDSIIISIPLSSIKDNSDLSYPLHKIAIYISILHQEMLKIGLCLRGVITIGSLYCQESIIVGKALIEAIEKEKNIPVYPRIILTNNLISRLEKVNFYPNSIMSGILSSDIIRDLDGLIRIRLFSQHDALKKNKNLYIQNEKTEKLIKDIKIKINKKIKKYKEKDLKIFSKWSWLLSAIEYEQKDNRATMRKVKNLLKYRENIKYKN